jgi:ribosome-binding protein aMBF1 (putative translation factor)
MLTLTKARQSLKLSQAKLAQRADMHPSTISNIETGNLKPWDGQRKKIEAALKELGWDNSEDLFTEVAE